MAARSMSLRSAAAAAAGALLAPLLLALLPPGAEANCQYVGVEAKRPENSDLVAICPSGPQTSKFETDACVAHSKAGYHSNLFSSGKGSVAVVEEDDITMSKCEKLCTDGWPSAPENVRKENCLGFVVRNTKTTKLKKHKPTCFLIPADAPRSQRFPSELHWNKTTRLGFGKTTDKVTFIKEICDCPTRYVQLKQPVERTKIAMLKAKRRNMLLNHEGPTDALPQKAQVEVKALTEEIDAMTEALQEQAEIQQFEGIYDYLPLHIPHRIYKGKLSWLPRFALNWFTRKDKEKREVVDKLPNKVAHFWESPVRISNVYKKTDFSAVMYKCMVKGYENHPEHWYLITRQALEVKVAKMLGLETADEIKGLKEDMGLQVLLFFNMECMGYQLKDSGRLMAPTKLGQLRRKTDTWLSSLSNGPGTFSTANRKGCFPNEEKANEARERYVISGVLNAAHEMELQERGEAEIESPSMWETPAEFLDDVAGGDANELDLDLSGAEDEGPLVLNLNNSICQSLLVGADATLGKINMAEKAIQYQNLLGVAWATASKVSTAWDKVASAFKGRRFFGFGTKATEATTTTTEMQVPLDRKKLLLRTKELVETMKQVMIRLYAIAETSDEHLKVFCAKEMLDLVQNVGGIWPKISQNLAVRPDIVEDDFARNKLKETQSGNKNAGKEATIAYIQSQNVTLRLGDDEVPLLDLLEYDRFLSAGSVGQVDMFRLIPGTPWAKHFLENHIPADWHGTTDKFIVKTVFEDTELQYRSDFKLMEIFFTNLKKYLPGSINTIWAVLKNMEASIFDEFDLRKEARFTVRGRRMLREYTEKYLVEKKVTATAPVGLETSSRYVMLQTIARGQPLKSHLERIKGQWDALVAWRQDIYSTILGVFGYTSMREGFFQSDPHPGNWFWHEPSRTLSLIDWGGVEDWSTTPELQKAHCNLAWLYWSMGTLVPTWNDCDSVTFETDSKKLKDYAGVYGRKGISVYSAAEGEESLLMGQTYSLSYQHKQKPYSLWFDGETWKISEVQPQEKSPYTTKLQMKEPGIFRGSPPEQSFFGKVLGQRVEKAAAAGLSASVQWHTVDGAKVSNSGHAATMRASSDRTCSDSPSRTTAYQKAAIELGIKMQHTCHKFMFVKADDPEVKAELLTDTYPIVCIRMQESKVVGAVGVPAKYHRVVGTLDHPQKLLVDITGEDGDVVKVVELELYTEKLASKNLQQVLGSNDDGTGVDPQALKTLSDQGMERYIEPREEGLPGLEGAGPLTRQAVYAQAERAYALAASLFDSDVAEAALQALKARQSLSLFVPGVVPEVYTLFARCVVVFHGMVADVLRENFLRLVPMQNLQWLLQSQQDGFFETWQQYAFEFLSDVAGDKCQAGEQWQKLRGTQGTVNMKQWKERWETPGSLLQGPKDDEDLDFAINSPRVQKALLEAPLDARRQTAAFRAEMGFL